MKFEDKNYCTINEFAKIFGITRHTLYHYDEIGLFHPVYTAPNGYRYYSYAQYDILQFILTLKQIGVPLLEIKKYLENSTTDTVTEMAEENIKTVDEEIEKLKRMRAFMEGIVHQVEKTSKIDTSKITVETLEAVPITLSPRIFCKNDYDKSMEAYATFCFKNRVTISDTVGSIIPLENIRRKKYYDYTYVYKKSGEDTNAVIHAGQYLTGYHVGAFETCYRAYERLMDYAGKHRMRLDTQGYEEYLIDDTFSKNNEYLAKIFIRLLS